MRKWFNRVRWHRKQQRSAYLESQVRLISLFKFWLQVGQRLLSFWLSVMERTFMMLLFEKLEIFDFRGYEAREKFRFSFFFEVSSKPQINEIISKSLGNFLKVFFYQQKENDSNRNWKKSSSDIYSNSHLECILQNNLRFLVNNETAN